MVKHLCCKWVVHETRTRTSRVVVSNIGWAVLSDEQMRKIWQFSLLNDEQMSNKVEVKHQPVGFFIPKFGVS